MRFRTIKSFRSTLGGEGYRATSDGVKVNIQRMGEGASSWRTQRTMSQSDFDAYAEHVALYDPYRDDPGLLARLIGNHEYDEDDTNS